MITALLGPALSFGSSLISGLGARQSAKKQQKIQAAYEYMNFVNRQADIVTNRTWTNWKNDQDAALGTQLQGRADAMRDTWNPANISSHAAAAGFNPATWLSVMGGAYAANSQAAESMWATGLSMKSPQIYLDAAYEQQAPTTQVPSVTEAVGGALQAGVNTLLTDWRAMDSRNFQREQLATQIAAIQANGGKAKSAVGVPVSQRSFFGSGQLPYQTVAGKAGTASGPQLGYSDWKSEEVKVTSPLGYGVQVNPNVADAGAFTDRYGESELVELGVAGYNMAQDMSWLYFGRTIGGAAKQGYRTLFGYTDYPDGSRGITGRSGGIYTGEQQGPQPMWTGGSAPSAPLSVFPQLEMRKWQGSDGW